MVAREQEMDPHFSVDVDCVVDRGIGGARGQDFDRPGSSFSEIRTSLEWPALELKISRVPVRARRCFDRILRCSCFRELATRSAVFDDPNSNWLLSDLRWRALFIGRHLCGDSGNLVCDSGLALHPPPNRRSEIGNQKLGSRRVHFLTRQEMVGTF